MFERPAHHVCWCGFAFRRWTVVSRSIWSCKVSWANWWRGYFASIRMRCGNILNTYRQPATSSPSLYVRSVDKFDFQKLNLLECTCILIGITIITPLPSCSEVAHDGDHRQADARPAHLCRYGVSSLSKACGKGAGIRIQGWDIAPLSSQ